MSTANRHERKRPDGWSTTVTCVDCGVAFELKQTRGKLRERCWTCRGKREAAQKAESKRRKAAGEVKP